MNEEVQEASNLPILTQDGRQLIVKAFEVARMSGRDDWTEMTTAVLKNRLLDLTGRAFKESDYGARNIADFVTSFPDLVTLDRSAIPPKVTLIDSSRIKGPSLTRGRIRSDLWRAIIDYRSDSSYYWNGAQALPLDPEFADTQGGNWKIPTISHGEMESWRQDFRENLPEVANLNDQELEQVETWESHTLPTTELPPLVRGLWNEYLNERVTKRLKEWFSENSLPLPENMLHRRSPHRDAAPVGVAQLRELILRTVRAMTETELRSMALPPAAVLRAFGGSESGIRAGLGR
ncbi:hypothetical protein [Streptomyces sp. C10-9-1]|uniref:hypothetical protein n=1 Tax=Streptomyces sp. C10-9-1 TaxID=1859285 RepID=UPI003D7474FA